MNSQDKSSENKAGEKEYIKGAGGSIVSKSILNGSSKLKWLFRQESEYGNGWVAFGDTDTQEYVDDAKNMQVVDFNTLANIEPTVLNVFYMPVGSDLEFCSDQTGKYFIDTRTGKEIREPVKHPVQLAFEKNLKFLNQDTYPVKFFSSLFTENELIKVLTVGRTDFPTGEVTLADPIAYLGTKYETVLDKKIPVGSYDVDLSICRFRSVGLRIVAARLRISDEPIVRYEIAMPKGKKREDLGKPNVWTFYGVDTGLACIADAQTANESKVFFDNWKEENPGKNKYVDYFASLFQNSVKMHPEFHNQGGSFLEWQMPNTEHKLVMFSSGMGDGMYSGYWGLDKDDNAVALVLPFMNPEYFK